MTAVRLGDYLREAREKSGLSLEQLAERTRVRIDNLAALEREDLDALPADAYVRGFVKIVCRELRLPPEEGLALYARLRSTSELPDEIVWSEENVAKEPGALDKALQDPERVILVARTAKKWAIPLGALLLVVIIALVVRGAGVGAQEGGEELGAKPGDAPGSAEPGAQEDATALHEAEKLLAALETKPKSETTTPPVPQESRPAMIRTSAPKEPAKAAAPETASDATNTSPESSSVAAEGAHHPESTSTIPVAAAPPAITSPETLTAASEPLTLEIEAIREAEVTLLLDGGGFPRKRNLITGERKSWKADSLFVISASDAGAIRLTLNGADLGSPGESGTPLANHVVRR
jgi:cytoskeletal protein RodZ